MSMRHFITILEAVTDRDQALIDYLSAEASGFNPAAHWRHFAEWAPHADDGSGVVVADLERLSGADIANPEYDHETDAIMALDPSIYDALPAAVRSEFEGTLGSTNLAGNTHGAFSLLSPNKLPADTLLIHFTDDASDIARHGFRIGIPDMHALGETVRLPSWMKQGPGYNFAYLASQAHHAIQSGSFKRGHAVVFRHTGVLVEHYGDRETQVIFWGPYVPVEAIIGVYEADSPELDALRL